MEKLKCSIIFLIFSFSLFLHNAYAVDIDKIKKGAEQGDPKVQTTLGVILFTGQEGVKKNPTEAVKWIRKAAEQGEDNAQLLLGTFYYSGVVVKKDLNESSKWYKKSAKQGNAKAQMRLATAYYEGIGIEKNYTEAAKWMKKSAEQGIKDAQLYLARLYYAGNGVKKNKSEAAKWMKKAAEQGVDDAQYALGIMYFRGDGVSRDYAKAEEWTRKALEQGHKQAISNLDIILKKRKTEAAKKNIKAFIEEVSKDPKLSKLMSRPSNPSTLKNFYIVGEEGGINVIQDNEQKGNAKLNIYIGLLSKFYQDAGFKEGQYTGWFRYNPSKGTIFQQPINSGNAISKKLRPYCRTMKGQAFNSTLKPLKRPDGNYSSNVWSLLPDNSRGSCMYGNFTSDGCKLTNCYKYEYKKAILTSSKKIAIELAKMNQRKKAVSYSEWIKEVEDRSPTNSHYKSLPGYFDRGGACGAISCNESDTNNFILDQYW